MRENYDSWLQFVNGQDGLGLGLEEQGILFVSGTTKTTNWGVAAFQGNGSERKEGRISAQFTPYATANFSVSLANTSMPSSQYRYGPRHAQENRVPAFLTMLSEESQPRPPELKRDQCLFIHYYKMRRRILLAPRAIQAAAGPQDFMPGPKSPGMDSSATSDAPNSDFVFDSLPVSETV